MLFFAPLIYHLNVLVRPLQTLSIKTFQRSYRAIPGRPLPPLQPGSPLDPCLWTWLGHYILTWQRGFPVPIGSKSGRIGSSKPGCLQCLRSFAPVCALLRTCFCALLRPFVCFCVRPPLEQPHLGITNQIRSGGEGFGGGLDRTGRSGWAWQKLLQLQIPSQHFHSLTKGKQVSLKSITKIRLN